MNRRRRGVVLVVVLWAVAVLAAVCLSLGAAAGFRKAGDAALRDDLTAEQALLSATSLAKSLLLADATSADTLDDEWTAETPGVFTLPLAQGRVTLFVPDAPDRPYGLEDESGRINANTAGAETLAGLPGMSSAVAEAFVMSREFLADHAEAPGLTGLIASDAQLERALTEAFVYSGSIESAGPADPTPAAVRLAMRHLTVYTRQRNVDARGRRRVNINTASQAEMLIELGEHLSAEQIRAIVNSRQTSPFESIGELLTRSMKVAGPDGRDKTVRIRQQEFRFIADRLTVTGAEVLAGLVNVNTAPAEVLRCLPGLTDARAADIIARRTAADSLDAESELQSVAWLLDVLDEETFEKLCPYVTTRSAQFRMHAEATVGPEPDAFAGDARQRGETLRAGRYARAVIERDGGRCSVLMWVTWSAPARTEPLER